MESDTYLKLTKSEVEIMYCPGSNLFVSEGGCRIDNIFDYITPNDLYLFQKLSKPDEIFVIPGSKSRSTVLIHTYVDGECNCMFCEVFDDCMGDIERNY